MMSFCFFSLEDKVENGHRLTQGVGSAKGKVGGSSSPARSTVGGDFSFSSSCVLKKPNSPPKKLSHECPTHLISMNEIKGGKKKRERGPARR